MAYGILRWDLFDIDIKVKWTIRRGTLLAILAVLFFVAKEGLEALFPGEGVLAGIGAAVAVAGLVWPTWLMAGALTERVMPGSPDAPEHLARRKADVYRATLERALADGVIRPKERAMLDGLASQLGISSAETRRIEEAADEGEAGR